MGYVKGENIEDWRRAIDETFPELVFPAEVGLSVISQLFIKDVSNPFGLVYVDAPSSGKTITLNFFSGLEELVYATDNFSPASFVSQATNVKKKDLEKVDFLPKIKDKVLLVRDLAPIFGARDDDLLKTMGILTRIFDGEGLWLDGGVHGGRGYRGDYLFMFLAGSTPITTRVWKTMGNFGSRLFFCCIGSKEKDEEVLAKQLISKAVREKEEKCRLFTRGFIDFLSALHTEKIKWNKKNDSMELLKMIGRIAKVLARLRGTINVWEKRVNNIELEYTPPLAEMPDRINQCLYNLARGHAVVCGREKIEKEDIALVLKVALDSAPPTRAKLFSFLLNCGGIVKTEKVMEKIKCSRPTAHKEMEALKMLGLVDVEGDDDEELTTGRPQKTITLKKKFDWFLSEESFELRGKKKPKKPKEKEKAQDTLETIEYPKEEF